jgi:hypothetical protein
LPSNRTLTSLGALFFVRMELYSTFGLGKDWNEDAARRKRAEEELRPACGVGEDWNLSR